MGRREARSSHVLVCAVMLVFGTAGWKSLNLQINFTSAATSKVHVQNSETILDDSKREAGRRDLFIRGAAAFGAVATGVENAEAVPVKNVVVAGATGQTGRKIVERLAKRGDLGVVGGVRDVKKAEKALSESSIAVRGAMLDEVKAVDTKGVQLKALDVAKDSVDKIAETLKGADALVIATGFVPGNPFAMNQEAHAVDNVGTINLVDACKKAGVSKVVLVTSILTNARAWGQENSAGFQVTNAFGGVLDEKLVAEKYLMASGLDYTIVRPGGLKATPPSGNLIVSKEDTLNGGEVSRDLVADVCVASLFDTKAASRIVEIIEGTEAPGQLPQEKWFA